MQLKVIGLTFCALLVLLFSYSVQAATTYDFSTRNAGVNAFAYDGISSTVLPLNNTFPSNQHDNTEYTNISVNNGSVNTVSTSQNNNYPILRYVFELDEAEINIAQLDFFWNGKGTNDNNGRDDGVVLYIWNYSTSSYEQISTSGNTSSEVDLTHAITVNIIDYIDENNNNKLTLLVVSNDKANGNKANTIEADYVSIEVQTASPTKLSVTTNNVSHDYDVSSYGGSSQDKTGTVDIRDAGSSLFIEGNRWQKIVLPYTVTTDTVIEFDFQSTVQGEIQGLGFDDNLTLTATRSFKVYGTQNWGLPNFATYTGNGVTHFKIPVGQFYTGNFQYLFFMHDDDDNPTSNSLYSNIVIYEKNLTGNLIGNLNVDNTFEAYISTDDAVQGTLLTSGTNWPTTYNLASLLTSGQEYFLHIKAKDAAAHAGDVAGFLGDFSISGTSHTFSNGLTTLNTNTTDWVVSTTGWSNYQPVSAYGTNGVSPWGAISGVDNSATWIWSSDNKVDEINYFSAKIVMPIIKPLAEYRFEEISWNATAGEIIDSSGNGHHGQMKSNSTPLTLLPALTGNIGTCGYASQNDGSIEITGLPLDNSTIGVKTTVTFWMNWDGTNNSMPIGWDTHDIWLIDGSMGFNTGNSDVYGISSAGLANGWHHVAAEFTNGSVTSNRMYIDGVEQVLTQRQSSPNNNKAIVDSELRIGGWSHGSGYEFHGLIDEVRVYQNALATSQINTIMAERHPCPSVPIAEYRFDELSWDGTASEVIDNSGNNYNGAAIGGVSTMAGKICNAAYIPNNDSATKFEAVDTGIDVDTIIGSNGTISLWYKADSAWNSGSNKRLFDATGSNKYFAADINSNGQVKFYFEDGSDGDYQKTTVNSFSVGAGVWKHLTFIWDVSTNTAKIFVDGVEQTLSGGTGQTTAVTGFNTLYFGDNRNPSYFTGQSSASGLIDEALIFDSVLTVSQIQGIFSNQDAGNNYDGRARTCPTPATLLLEYRFEEASWNGVAGEILDNTGNGYHAQALRNSILVNPAPAIAPSAIQGDPGTCGYTSQTSGAIQTTGLPLDTTTIGVKTTVTFWMNWNGIESVMPIGWDVHDIWLIDGSMGFNTGGGDLYGISSAGLANGWHHVAVEFTNGSVTDNRMYIDGVEQVLTQRRNSPNNSRAIVDSELRIGGWSHGSGYEFHGLMDEVRIYEGVLTTTQVNTIMNEVHSCNTPIIDHYEISHDGQGLTCDTESVEIKACTDASCSNLSTQSVTLDFLADGALISSPTFTGSTIVNFNHTVVETLTFSVSNATLAASNAIVCVNGSSASCDMAFTDAGFRFISGTGNSTTILNQTSGAVFGEALKIQAVKSVDGVCTGLFTGNKSVDLSQENVAPSGTSGLSFSIGGNNIAKHSSVTSTPLNFGANSIAVIPTPIYNDAGQIRLHAHYDVGGVTLIGSSNPFWVSPAELVVSAKSGAGPGAINLIGATATATPTHKAGENFSLSVTAYNAASPSVITPNYKPGQIQFKLNRTGPTLGSSVDGELIYGSGTTSKLSTNTTKNVTLTNFSSGTSTYHTAQYSEVGLLNLEVEDINYGNANIIVPATAINIGRFIPYYFTQTIADDGSFLATCNTGTTFAYSGQKDEVTDSIGAISYLTPPILVIKAYNKQGNITQNYYEDSEGSVNDYMKLSASDVSVIVPTVDQAAIGADGDPLNPLPLTANMNTGLLSQNDLTALPTVVALSKGVLHYQLSGNDNFFYNRSANALVSPFTSDIDFSIATIKDADSVDLTPAVGSPTTVDASPTGVEIRFGRLLLENSFGPETSNLPQPMQIEHFDGTDFIVTDNNNCNSYDAGKVSLTNISFGSALPNVLGGTGHFVTGKTQSIELKAPGAEKQGNIGVSYDIYDWLKYDWDNDGAHDDNPTAVATFGLYRGNDRIIYSREVFD